MKKLLILLLLPLSVVAQTFTNYSKPVKVGTMITTGAYTLQFTWATDTGTHKNRSVNIWEAANQRAYIQYPYLYFNGYPVILSGKFGYEKICDRKPHQWLFRVGNGLKEVLLDSVLILSAPTTEQSINADLWFSSSSDIDKLTGTISNVVFTPSFVTLKREKEQPPQTLNALNIPKGAVYNEETNTWDFTNTKSCFDQLKEAADKLSLTFAAGTPKIHPMFDFYKAGGEDWGIAPDSCTRAGVAIAKILCDRFNCDLAVSQNTEDYMSYRNMPTSPHGRFNNAMIDLANSNPNYELRVSTSLSQLRDINGYKALTTLQVANMLPNEPLTTFDDEAQILFIHYTTIQLVLSQTIDYAMVDNEYTNKWLDTAKYALNAQCNAAKVASGLSWRDYCSRQYTNAMNRIYAGIKRAVPGISVCEYDVSCLNECGYYYDALFSYRIALNTNGEGTPQLYPRTCKNLLNGAGDYRGLLNSFMLGKRGEVKLGYNYNQPFYGIGYSGNFYQDINPTLAVGLETFVTGTGALTGYPSLYVQGGNNPNPKSYAYQMYSLAIAQSACAPVWDILRDGVLLAGDRNAGWLCYGGSNYTFWTGSYTSVASVVKKSNRYAITTYHTSISNLKDGQPLKQDIGIWLNGKYLSLGSYAQGGVYLYDELLPYQPDQSLPKANPKRVNSWVGIGVVENW